MIRDIYYTILFLMLIFTLIYLAGSINERIDEVTDAVHYQCRLVNIVASE